MAGLQYVEDYYETILSVAILPQLYINQCLFELVSVWGKYRVEVLV